MAVLVLTHPLPAAPYAQALRALTTEVPVWTEADAPAADAVEALLAWRLKPGQAPGFRNLRVVCSIGAGVDKLLAPDLPPQVAVTRSVDPQQARDIAQVVLAQVLRFTRGLDRYAEQQSRGHWQRHAARDPAQCRVGLLGQGEVAQAIARAALAFGLPVALWGRGARPLPGLDGQVQRHQGEAGLARLLESSDVLVGTLPLTAATRGLLDGERLRQLPRGAFVVNVGRGEHLVEDDLRRLLDDGHLGGAALDVFEREPLPPGHWIWQHPKVVATPHIAGEARLEVVAAQCLDALRRARGALAQPLAVDRGAGY